MFQQLRTLYRCVVSYFRVISRQLDPSEWAIVWGQPQDFIGRRWSRRRVLGCHSLSSQVVKATAARRQPIDGHIAIEDDCALSGIFRP